MHPIHSVMQLVIVLSPLQQANRYEEPDIEVKLSSEIKGSLNRLKVCG